MEVIRDFEKALEMGKRVYNGKMTEKVEEGKVIYSDEEAIRTLCSKVFGADGQVNSIEDLRSFNRLIVEVANYEAQGKVEQIINAIANMKTVGRYDAIQYLTVPQRIQTTVALSASATGVDFTKITSRQKKIPAIPKHFQFGVKYEISEMVSNPVNAFRSAVDCVVRAKVEFIFKQIMKLAKGGVTAGKIPAGQQSIGSNMTLATFRGLENKLIRRGNNSRPVLIADIAMINALALKQATEGIAPVANQLAWLTEELKTSLLRDITFDMVSRTLCIPTDNPFIDETNSKVDLAVNEAVMLAGGEGKPFSVTEYGSMRTTQDMPSIEKEEVLIKIDYVLDVTLLLGQNMCYLYDDSVTL